MVKTVESKKRKASMPESGAVKVKKIKQVVEATPAAEAPAKKRKASVPESGAVKVKKVKKVKQVLEEPSSEVDDQTEALLKGFESDGDDQESGEEAFEEGEPVPEVKMTKGQKKALKKAQEEADGDKPGVLFISRIPHGFFEHQMKEYFGQFGTILQLRLSRNKATGASKHYAFIQFESTTVAEIVAKTMDNYLLFSHILKVKVVPDAAVPANLWKGAGKRFKTIPRNKIAGRKLNLPATEEIWDKRAEQVQEKREAKAAKLKEMGYEMPLPTIKSAKGLAKEYVEAPAAIEAEKPAEDTVEPKKVPKSKKVKKTVAVEEIIEEPVADAPAEEPVKIKRTKVTTTEYIEEAASPAVEEEKPKKKAAKGKKAKKTSVA